MSVAVVIVAGGAGFRAGGDLPKQYQLIGGRPVIWWTLKAGAATGERPSAGVIWERFPKFVLGFIVASIVFSFLLPADLVTGTRSALGELRVWWFALAFVCIGLETRFIELAATEQGRPALAFVGAQTINVFWTLLLAYLLFGGVIFPQPDIK